MSIICVKNLDKENKKIKLKMYQHWSAKDFDFNYKKIF